jgi:hypothetical protein
LTDYHSVAEAIKNARFLGPDAGGDAIQKARLLRRYGGTNKLKKELELEYDAYANNQTSPQLEKVYFLFFKYSCHNENADGC